MKNIAVIACIYNNLAVCKESIETAIKLSKACGQLILIDNHAPDPEIRQWLKDLTMKETNVDHLTILDPGRNIGCHHGFNHGFKDLLPTIEYVVKLDDDTFIRTEGWDEKMRASLQLKKIAYVSADIDPDAKQKNKYRILEMDGIKYEIPETGIVGFSCVMFRRADIIRWGPMQAAHETKFGTGLYGGEEAHYSNLASADALSIAHLPGVYCDHAKNEHRHPDYPMWKWLYGYKRWIDDPMDVWLKDPVGVLGHYRKRMMEELRQTPMNIDFVEYTIARLGKLGDDKDMKKLRQLAAEHLEIVKLPKLQEKFLDAANNLLRNAEL